MGNLIPLDGAKKGECEGTIRVLDIFQFLWFNMTLYLEPGV
jgi:hypothetical protein